MPADDPGPVGWAALAADPGHDFVALWAEAAQVLALYVDAATAQPRLVTAPLDRGRYPALSPDRPAARWFEAAILDLWGHAADGGAGAPPALLQHGAWGQRHPLAPRPQPMGRGAPPEPEEAFGPDRHQVGIGPASADGAAPAHLRLTVQAGVVQEVQVRLGYAHRGVTALLRGKSPRAAAPTVARIAGDSTVAHATAFARAAEALTGSTPPLRAQALRGVLAELERIAGHLRAVGAVAAAADIRPLAALGRTARETLLRAAAAAFGHRLLMDVVVPGGVAHDIAPGGAAALDAALTEVAADLATLRRDAERRSGLRRRLEGLGVTPAAQVRAYGAGGPAGRAAGRIADRRIAPGYPPYDSHPPVAAHLSAGDAWARLLLLLAEIADSLRLVRTLLAALPAGPVTVPLPPGSGTGLGWAEGPRGDCWCALRLDAGLVTQAFPRDPGWALWPLFVDAAPGTAPEDLGLLRASLDPGGPGLDV